MIYMCNEHDKLYMKNASKIPENKLLHLNMLKGWIIFLHLKVPAANNKH